MKYQLVKNEETGAPALQMVQGSHCATLELPPDFGTWVKDRQEIFIERFITEAKKNLKTKSPFKRRSR